MNTIPALPWAERNAWDWDESTRIRDAQAEPEAFSAIYVHYLVPVYRYLRARSDTDQDAEDLTQQVFLKALDALPRYREQGAPFGGWLFRIARNVAMDAHRRHKITVSWDLLPESLQPRPKSSVEDAVLQDEALDRLRVLLAELEVDQRELLSLRFVAGLTAREIAAVVDKSEAAVHKQLHRILRMLQERYDVG